MAARNARGGHIRSGARLAASARARIAAKAGVAASDARGRDVLTLARVATIGGRGVAAYPAGAASHARGRDVLTLARTAANHRLGVIAQFTGTSGATGLDHVMVGFGRTAQTERCVFTRRHGATHHT